MDKPTPPATRHRPSDPAHDPNYATIPVEAEQPSVSERVLHAGWEIVKTVSIIVIVALLIRTFLVQPFFVDGESMEPSFHPRDYLLVNQLNYNLSPPKRGDVVVFKAPLSPDENYIKRVIAVPGETVELRNGAVVVTNQQHGSGVTVSEPYIQAGVRTLAESSQTKWQLSADQYFMLGDNRLPGMSSDSRAFGPVPKANLVGKVALRVYPLADFGTIKKPAYENLAEAFSTRLATVPIAP